ncbi:MAG: SDR family NAD(P)-dependent oxidoreductase [Candidatus Solibacter usitatus]|nr:SDR family NAD(P)-dependent oxidoreductase [Candidatus Solibacter usitatus]
MSKVVLITGCSSGIGRLTAELFARRGWDVAATARLRYPVGGALVRALSALFPDSFWRSLNAAGMTRPSK